MMRACIGLYVGFVILGRVAAMAVWPHVPKAVVSLVGKEVTVSDAHWQALGEFEVKAKPAGLWTIALEHVSGPVRLKLVVDPPSQEWQYSKVPLRKCKADGDLLSHMPSQACICPDAPVGALIGKLGGSSSGAAKDGTTFVVGSFCVFVVGKDAEGPLFLTINDDRSGFDDNDLSVKVKIFQSAGGVARDKDEEKS
jgi:hypothetical protein